MPARLCERNSGSKLSLLTIRENLRNKWMGEKVPVKRFILSGAPGSGKTAILRQLEVNGFVVVEEAATDVIALWQARGITEPWTDPSFIDAIVDLQSRRELQAGMQQGAVQFHDRSVLCTAALAGILDIRSAPPWSVP
jgi:predicted ATPase